MIEDINQKILDMIKSSKCDESIKEFLKKILLLELRHFEEERWMYKKDYDRYIFQYTKKYKGGENVDRIH